MAGKIKNYYAGGNTARGFHNLYDSNLQGLDRLFILKGGPGTGKSSLMKKIGNEWVEKGYNIELLHCSSDNQSIDGVIIPALKVGIVDGTAPHVIEPKAPGAIEQYINLGEAWDVQVLGLHKNKIQRFTYQINQLFQKAYSTFNEALEIHDDWEKIYINSMDFNKADQLTNRLIAAFLGKMKLNKKSDIRHRFLGAATPMGAVDFVPNLTEDISKRYFIKGRPGSGKSTMLKKLAAAAEERGVDAEIYHCGFDPNSLDMVIFRELGIAIFDSTAPHEYFPSRDGDEIIDMYELLIAPKTDELYAEIIERITAKYKEKMAEATSYLAKAKELHDKLEAIYISAMDFTVVEEIQNQIAEQIRELAGVRVE
ncbi:PRK06851 family protein [Neobacillus massiliamazoniensis]|uniref:Putative nucleotide kinase n=1 Tax=Neobacillus massiliamazoniensis TaxID=1499688 RepID=A0A0U1NX13_9BACI|nr:PRK06851 family protein [Neobacillus massiliamazoniensis]CRK82554.1 putative nucleotide kinase [Neobacillus massiliamazoniensis]